MNNKTILVTGGTGYLGSHVVRRLIYEGAKVIVLKRSFSNLQKIKDLSNRIKFINIDEANIEDAFRENSIDIIVHCATNYGRANTKPTHLIDANLMLPLTLLQLALQYGVKSFINTDTILDTRVNYYALSKGHFCDWLKTFSKKIVCCNVALEHFYGPNDDKTKFVSYIINEMITQSEIINLTLGEQKREFIYISDVVDAMISICKFVQLNSTGYFRFEVGSGVTVSIKEIVKLIGKLCQNKISKINFGAIPYRENEIMKSNVDLSALLALGWAPLIPLEEGLLKTIEADITYMINTKTNLKD
jgi:CDP-paratose synthetase